MSGFDHGSMYSSSWSTQTDDRNSLDDLSDQKLVDRVMNLEVDYRRLKLETKIMMDYLKANDPPAMAALTRMLTRIKNKRHGVVEPSPPISTTYSMRSIVSTRSSKFSISTLASLGEGQKINVSQRTDMVKKNMEDIHDALDKFTKKCHKLKMNVKAELNEFAVRESDIKEAMEIFENTVIIQGYDPLTQRIPGEKFIRYMEEWLKSAHTSIQKLRLKLTTLKQFYKQVVDKVKQNKEMGETVRPVDFFQLEIENKYFKEQIDDKTVDVIDLKKLNGDASLVLANYKKHLRRQEKEYKMLQQKMEEKKKIIANAGEECKKKQIELDKARENYEKVKLLKASYRVPEVIDYVKIKNNIYDLKKQIVVWQRRKNIQDITLNSCIRQMKDITGRSKVDPAWLKDVVVNDVGDNGSDY